MSRRAITGILLIDGSGAPPRPNSTVLWDGDTIDWVGEDGQADLTGVQVIEANGGTVVPGLIDCHVHLCLDPVLDGVDVLPDEPLARVSIRAAQAAKTLLESGITTARDQGSREGVAIEVAAAQQAGWLVAARIVAAGRGVTPTKGHGWMIGVEADGPEAVRQAVAGEIERGADVIKLFPTGGVLGSGAHGFETTMTLEELQAAVEEAHAHDRLVGMHIHGPDGIELALEAGADTIEHGTGVTADQAQRMVRDGVALVPTLTAIEALAGSEEELPEEVLGAFREVRSLAAAGVRRAIEAGVRVLPGTDAGTPFNPPGELTREMTLLAELGLGNGGVIDAATSLAADTLGLGELGLLTPGKRADLVLVNGDPLSDLMLLADPRIVVQDGTVRVV